MVTPRGTAACEAESEHSLTKERRKGQKGFTFNTWQQLWMLHSGRECLPFLAEVPRAGRLAPHWWKVCWSLGLLGRRACAAAWAPEEEAGVNIPEGLSSGSLLSIKKWVTGQDWAHSDQATQSSWSGFRAGCGGPCKHAFSGILGGGKESVMVWALASGHGERNLRKRIIQTNSRNQDQDWLTPRGAAHTDSKCLQVLWRSGRVNNLGFDLYFPPSIFEIPL